MNLKSEILAAFSGCSREVIASGVSRSRMDTKRAASIGRRVRETRSLQGDTAEVGILGGGTSVLIHAASGRKTHWACDTFEGLVDAGPEDGELVNGDFFSERVSVEPFLKQYEGIRLVVGYFPQSAPSEMSEARFAFVHIDVDTYRSVLNCFEWFSSRMAKGGIIALDDVLPERSGCPGAQQAWREVLKKRAGWHVIDEVPPQAVVKF